MNSDSELDIIFRANLKRILADRQLSLRDLEKLCTYTGEERPRISYSQLAKLQRKLQSPRLATVCDIADGLGIPPSRLLRQED